MLATYEGPAYSRAFFAFGQLARENATRRLLRKTPADGGQAGAERT